MVKPNDTIVKLNDIISQKSKKDNEKLNLLDRFALLNALFLFVPNYVIDVCYGEMYNKINALKDRYKLLSKHDNTFHKIGLINTNNCIRDTHPYVVSPRIYMTVLINGRYHKYNTLVWKNHMFRYFDLCSIKPSVKFIDSISFVNKVLHKFIGKNGVDIYLNNIVRAMRWVDKYNSIVMECNRRHNYVNVDDMISPMYQIQIIYNVIKKVCAHIYKIYKNDDEKVIAYSDDSNDTDEKILINSINDMISELLLMYGISETIDEALNHLNSGYFNTYVNNMIFNQGYEKDDISFIIIRSTTQKNFDVVFAPIISDNIKRFITETSKLFKAYSYPYVAPFNKKERLYNSGYIEDNILYDCDKTDRDILRMLSVKYDVLDINTNKIVDLNGLNFESITIPKNIYLEKRPMYTDTVKLVNNLIKLYPEVNYITRTGIVSGNTNKNTKKNHVKEIDVKEIARKIARNEEISDSNREKLIKRRHSDEAFPSNDSMKKSLARMNIDTITFYVSAMVGSSMIKYDDMIFRSNITDDRENYGNSVCGIIVALVSDDSVILEYSNMILVNHNDISSIVNYAKDKHKGNTREPFFLNTDVLYFGKVDCKTSITFSRKKNSKQV